jgi:hypothetical protein
VATPGDLDLLISEELPHGELARHLGEAGVEIVLATGAPTNWDHTMNVPD